MKFAGIVLIVCALINSSLGVGFTRIVKGSDAKDGEFPFMVSIQHAKDGAHECGASIITPLWILTAAHCVHPNTTFKVQYGSIKVDPKSKETAVVSKGFVHPSYNPKTVTNDIALLKLATPIPFGPKVAAVKLPKEKQQTAGKLPATILGWGGVKGGGKPVSKLQKAVVQTFSDDECRKLRERLSVLEANICAGVPDGSKGVCSGDSGGPLIVNNEQVGVVSFGAGDCKRVPGVFTEVSYFTKFITDTMKKNP